MTIVISNTVLIEFKSDGVSVEKWRWKTICFIVQLVEHWPSWSFSREMEMENRLLHNSVGRALAKLELQSRNGDGKPFASYFSW